VNKIFSGNNSKAYLSKDEVYATSGTISRPFSSMALSIEYTDRMQAMESQIESYASQRPGHFLNKVSNYVRMKICVFNEPSSKPKGWPRKFVDTEVLVPGLVQETLRAER